MKRLFACFSAILLFLACSKEPETPTPQPKPKFTITIDAGEGGSVSSTGGSYEQGSTFSVTATASSGYRFTGWSNGETSATLNITVTGNLSVTALFEKITYSVDISGAVSKGAFLTGSTLTFYELNNTLSQTGKSYNTDITDNFGTYALSVEELTEDYARVVGEGFYWNEVNNTNTEEKLSLNAIAEVKEGININVLTHLEYQRVIELVKNQSKSFVDAKKQALTETLSSLGIETTSDYGTSEQFNFKEGDEKSKILVVASAIIQAERTSAEVTELITTIANDLKDNGNIDNTDIKSNIAVGIQSLDLNVVASNIYDRYKEDYPELTQDSFTSNYLDLAKTEYQEFLPDDDNDGVWDGLDTCPDTPEGEEADENGCGKTQKEYQLTTTVEGEGSISEEVIEQTTASYDYGTTVRLTANPSTGWEFKEWTGGITSTDNPIDITVVEEVSVTAVFVRKNFTVTANTEGEGTISVDPEAESYEYESTVELTATPSEGWMFSEWKGAVTSSENPLSVVVGENIEITAVFKRKQYDLSVNIEGEGTVAEEIVAQPSQYEYETQVKLTANSAEGWEFTGWSGDLEGTENPTTITIDKAKVVTAIFEKADSDGDGVVDLEDLCPDTPEGATVNANGCHDFIYVAENGVTIKAKETAIIGDTQELNGETYKVVDESLLRDMVTNDEDVSKVVTTRVENMKSLFSQKESFNQDISSWDTSNVTDMNWMFNGATLFNQDISLWQTSNVQNMEGMFRGAVLFNQDISNWNTSSVINLSEMFYNAEKFNQDISQWDISNVYDLEAMFQDAKDFNQSLNSWDTSNVRNMKAMFYNASNFDGLISSWNTSEVRNMSNMFLNTSFNQNIGDWDVGLVEDMSGMFGSNTNFNQNIADWNVQNVTQMNGMFFKSEKFNQDIGNWNTSSLIEMNGMFEEAKAFNQDISKWDVSNVVKMIGLFYNNPVFNQDISSWCVSNISEEPYDFVSTNSVLENINFPIWGQCGEIELAANGVTIIANENAVAGESYKLSNDGDSYLVVDQALLIEMNSNREDVSHVVTTLITNMEGMFNDKETFNDDISSWDVSNVTNMRAMFYKARSFNADISKWDVSNVTDMELMFRGAESFDQPIGSWNMSSVEKVQNMFRDATSFDQDLSNWDMSNKIWIGGMFYGATSFNQPLNNWDVSNISDFSSLFKDATSFNHPLDNWDVQNAGNNGGMDYMFNGAQSFNQDISMWCVSNIIDAPQLFSNEYLQEDYVPVWGTCPLVDDDDNDGVVNHYDECPETEVGVQVSSNGCKLEGIYIDDNGVTIKARESAQVGDVIELNGVNYTIVDNTTLDQMVANDEDLTKVVTTFVTNMEALFLNKGIFNQDISSWDVSNVTTMRKMFEGATLFNQDLSYWDVSSVESFTYMFYNAENFNKPLNTWNTSSLKYAYATFANAKAFNQNIDNWDVSAITDMSYLFWGAETFNQPLNSWDVSNVELMKSMFYNTDFDQPLNNWDTSSVIDMSYMFSTTSFNQDIGSWDVSNVRTMSYFLFSNQEFNQDIGNWDVSQVSDMSWMFGGATGFNQDITNWNTSSLTNMSYMFETASSFNQEIGSWNVSNVTDMSGLFSCRNAGLMDFQGDLNGWDTSKVTNMSEMFRDNAFSNPKIEEWDTSSVTTMNRMFDSAFRFNRDISSWNVSQVTDMFSMFRLASEFNQNLNEWNTESVINMQSMFEGASIFNGEIGNWNTSNVEKMMMMFLRASKFNQNIGNWDVSNVSNMRNMFQNASVFNQDIGSWDVSKVVAMNDMFRNASDFNQDLSSWCVSYFGSGPEPGGFSAGATSWTLPKPIWGTCPD